jgi:hypothetical protein
MLSLIEPSPMQSLDYEQSELNALLSKRLVAGE